jgi:hypothetical protein
VVSLYSIGGTADVPGYLIEMIDDQILKDPYGFPDDSVIYREWKAISTAVGNIKQASENVETRARSVDVQNQGLVNDINNCEIVVRARAIQGQV